MADLDAFRKWLSTGKPTDGLPTHWTEEEKRKQRMKPDAEEAKGGSARQARSTGGSLADKVKKASGKIKRPRFTMSVDGEDALLGFGRYSGSNVSDLARDEDGNDYLHWMIGQEFPDELKQVIQLQLGRHVIKKTNRR